MKNRYDSNWYKSVLNAMEDFVLVKGEKSKLLWANKAFLDYYGMNEEELYNIVDSEHSDPDDTLQYVRDDNYVFSNNKTLDIPSEPVTDSKGIIRYFHTIKSPISNSNGQVERSVGVSRHITDDEIIEKSSEDRESRKAFINFQKEFVKQIQIPSLFLDVQQRIILVSDSFANMFSLETSFFISKQVQDVFPNLDLQQESIREFSIKLNNIEKHGDLTTSSWNFSDKEVGGHIIFFKNRTEEINLSKQLEEEKRRSIISDRLKSLGELSAGVGHEINNPLAIIQGAVDKINILHRSSIEDKQVLEDLDKIKRNAIRISKIVKGLKSFSRESSLDDETIVNISEIIEDTFSLSEGRIESLGIQIKKSIDQNFQVSCKPGQISQVILNLINNSIDEIKGLSSPWIQIKTDSNEHGNYISVIDSGKGIPSDTVNQIFDPFFTTKPVGEGTGLGLGLSLEIINKHRGKLYYDHDQDNTTFTIFLPKVAQ